jgi:putative NIF3 family GTP cyclohydrolase 1 type 2
MSTVREIFDFAIEMGIKNDPRGQKEIKAILKEHKEEYQKLDAKKKQFYNKEKLTNPYLDSVIFYGEKRKISKILVGVDCETPELLLVKELNRGGAKIDGVLAHHPEGRALQQLSLVMDMQAEIMNGFGVSINIIEKLMTPRIAQVARGTHAINADRPVRAAELLDIPYFNIHTPTDNLAYQFIQKNICQKSYRRLSEVVEALIEIPEYHEATLKGNPPEIVCGNPKSKPGKVATTGFTGGTGGSEKTYGQLAAAGIGTILEMHIDEKSRKEAEKHHLNVIVCSHMASDSLGINQLCDEIEKKGVEVVPISGLTRVKRKK